MAGDRNIDLKPKLLISKNFTMIDLYNSTDVMRSFTRQYKLRPKKFAGLFNNHWI